MKKDTKRMQNYNHLINEMLGQVLQDGQLRKCFKHEVKIHPERIGILHQVIMNYDRMSRSEIQEKAYLYASSIKEEELLARQIFLCLMYLSEM